MAASVNSYGGAMSIDGKECGKVLGWTVTTPSAAKLAGEPAQWSRSEGEFEFRYTDGFGWGEMLHVGDEVLLRLHQSPTDMLVINAVITGIIWEIDDAGHKSACVSFTARPGIDGVLPGKVLTVSAGDLKTFGPLTPKVEGCDASAGHSEQPVKLPRRVKRKFKK